MKINDKFNWKMIKNMFFTLTEASELPNRVFCGGPRCGESADIYEGYANIILTVHIPNYPSGYNTIRSHMYITMEGYTDKLFHAGFEDTKYTD